MRLRGNAMLILTAMIWGAAFVAQRSGMNYIGPFTFNGIRSLLGAAVLFVVIMIFTQIQRKKQTQQKKRFQSTTGSLADAGIDHCSEDTHSGSASNSVKADFNNSQCLRDAQNGLAIDGTDSLSAAGGADACEYASTGGTDADPGKGAAGNDRKLMIIGGVLCGIILFVASSLQQAGLVYTEAGKASFITALYIVLVPLFGIFTKKKIRPLLWVCVLVAVIGLYLLCIKEGFSIGKGDLFVLGCAVVYTFHILVIDYFSAKVNGVKMSCIQLFVCGLISIPFMLIFEKIDFQLIFECWLPICYAGILSCGVGYTLQIVAQKYTKPTVASLLMSLESVFGLLAGWVLLGEQLSGRELVGCLIMFAAIIASQLPVVNGENDN